MVGKVLESREERYGGKFLTRAKSRRDIAEIQGSPALVRIEVLARLLPLDLHDLAHPGHNQLQTFFGEWIWHAILRDTPIKSPR